jgi:hypothetical protein
MRRFDLKVLESAALLAVWVVRTAGRGSARQPPSRNLPRRSRQRSLNRKRATALPRALRRRCCVRSSTTPGRRSPSAGQGRGDAGGLAPLAGPGASSAGPGRAVRPARVCRAAWSVSLAVGVGRQARCAPSPAVRRGRASASGRLRSRGGLTEWYRGAPGWSRLRRARAAPGSASCCWSSKQAASRSCRSRGGAAGSAHGGGDPAALLGPVVARRDGRRGSLAAGGRGGRTLRLAVDDAAAQSR